MRTAVHCALTIGLLALPACTLILGDRLSGTSPPDLATATDGAPADGGSARITWRDTRTVTIGSYKTTFTLPLPPSAVPGDLLLAGLALGSSANTQMPVFTAPVGWITIDRIDQPPQTTLALYWHIVGASEPASYDFTSDLGVEGSTFISAYGGVDATSPIAAERGQAINDSVTTYSTPLVTADEAGALLVATFAGYGPVTTWTAPAGAQVRANVTNPRSLLTFEVVQPTGGALTATASVVQDYALTDLLVLRPAP